MGPRFAWAIALAATAFVCAGCTSTGATAADAAAPPIDSGGTTDKAPCGDGSIVASNYDQACTVDTDCRLIAEGNACTPCAFNCANAAISVGALARYKSDVANKPAVASEFNGQTCAAGCVNEIGPCCIGGKCQMGVQCEATGPAACAAAGGQCLLGGAQGTCSKVGPQDCNPERNPGGAFCCLALNDAGDASMDAGVCPANGGIPTLTFDEQLAYECDRDAGIFSNVGVSTKECGGVIAIIVQKGVDGQTMYLYEPSSKACLEVAGGYNGQNDCFASVSGIPLATSCTHALGYSFPDNGPFGFVNACGADGGAAGDSGPEAGSGDSSTGDAADAAHE